MREFDGGLANLIGKTVVGQRNGELLFEDGSGLKVELVVSKGGDSGLHTTARMYKTSSDGREKTLIGEEDTPRRE